ncbi:MAG: glutamyl-tRNA reductase [Elusimicrobiota bacterium]|nr:glutamyl-tRNA reductase [Elusimicrobiota bacterium]
MNLQIYGINYKNTDIETREKYYLGGDNVSSVLFDFKRANILPSVIVSTCNRTEFYFSGNIKMPNLIYHKITEHFHKIEGFPAVRHLFRLTSGLESQILGENEILSQVKNAYYRSLNFGLTDKFFNQIFNHTLKTAKEVRRTTKISSGNISFASIVFNKTKHILNNIDGKNFLMLGTGTLAETILNYFSRNKIKLKIISGKNYDKATKLAELFETEVICFDKLKSAVDSADVIITATNAPHFVVKKNDLSEKRKNCLIFDLSVPRNVNPDVKSSKIILYNLDDLKKISDKNLELRKNSVSEAEKIIDGEIEKLNEIWKRNSELEQGLHLWH